MNLDFGNPENCPVCGSPIVGECDCVIVPSPLDDEMVEKVARAMYAEHRLPESSTDGSTAYRWGRVPGDLKDYWRSLSRAAIAALRGDSDA